MQKAVTADEPTVIEQDEFKVVFNGQNVVFFVNGELIDKDEMLRIPLDPQGLKEALADQPGLYAWVATLAAEAEADLAIYKDAVEVAEADADFEVRQELANRGERSSEEKVKKLVATHSLTMAAKEDYLFSLRKAKDLKALERSADARTQMLQVLGGIARDEFRAHFNA